MKKLLIIPLAAMALLSSCSTYQMSTLSSTNSTRDDKTGVFKLENDSVKILYSFAGKNAPIQLSIYNKLNEPLYVDWERSALIMDDKSYSYGDDAVQITGDVSGVSVGKRFRYSDASIVAQATLPKNVAFLPPHSEFSKTMEKISDRSFRPVPDSLFTKTKFPSFGAIGLTGKVAKFNKENSPLFFKSYLTVYTLKNNVPQFVAYQNDFYVSETIRSSSGPESFENFAGGRGDSFYGSASH
jgi:hypothetical protein